MSFQDDANIVASNLKRYARESRDRQKSVIKQRSIKKIHTELDLPQHCIKKMEKTGCIPIF